MIRGGFKVGGVAAGRDWADIVFWVFPRREVSCGSHPPPVPSTLRHLLGLSE